MTEIGIGLLGLGNVGCGVARTLLEKGASLSQRANTSLFLKKVLVRHLNKNRPFTVAPALLTTEAREILEDRDIKIVIELIGGERPALDYIKEAIVHDKHVVTANKEVIAKYGPELFDLASRHRVNLRFEASVGGGIPLIAPFQRDLAANTISTIYAIINGTTNYILTKMAKEGLGFSEALAQAQALGYAEADPTKDIEGVDAAYKLAILATLAFGTVVNPEQVHIEGISRLAARDFRYARELGYAIKLLGIGKQDGDAIQVRVHPVFLPEDMLLAKVDGVFNAVQVEGDLVGKVLFYGEGAGSLPTSSAVLADVLETAKDIQQSIWSKPPFLLAKANTIQPMSQTRTRYYLRMNVADSAGVLAQISRVLGDHNISISSVIQKETDSVAQSAEIVIMTHPAPEWAMQQALKEMGPLPVVREVSNFVRVEDPEERAKRGG